MNTTEGRGRDAPPPSILDAEGAVGHAGRLELGRVSLAHEAPVRLGALSIVPAHRQVAHDDGREEILEPRVMQVLVALIRAGGKIVSRDDLLDACWPGVVVGEDALNRVIGRLRRLSESLGAGEFRLETITKVGYRLVLPESRPEIAPLPLPTGPISAPGHRPALTAPGKPSIAVLPFKNLGGDGAKEYLADAITEDIVTALSQWRWFFVIARHSSFTYKDREIDPCRVGDELGVRYVLTGSVRPAGDRVRVTVQLTDATDGASVWANRFDRDLISVQVLDDEITQQVVTAIEPAMLWGEGARTARKPMADFSALDCFYRGMWRLNQMSEASDNEALALFREAVRLDPELSLGHGGVARMLYGRAIYGGSATPMEDMRASHASAQMAINLDPRDACGYFASSGACLYLGDHAAALNDARRSLALNPNFAYAQYRLGQVLIFSGSPEQAIAPIERSLRLSPYDPQLGPMLETLALAHYQAKDYAAAANHARIAGQLNGGASAVLAASLARLGQLDEAAEAFARANRTKRSAQRPMAAPYAVPAQLEHLRDGYRLAGMTPQL